MVLLDPTVNRPFVAANDFIDQPCRRHVQRICDDKQVRSADLAMSGPYIYDGAAFETQEIGHLFGLEVVIAPN